jgi:hypothetical protein
MSEPAEWTETGTTQILKAEQTDAVDRAGTMVSRGM